jgi:hypothetical protein
MRSWPTPDGTWPLAGQIVALGLVHVATCAVVSLAVGTEARAAPMRALIGRPGLALLH